MERKRLLLIYEAGERANPSIGELQRELRALRNFAATSLEAAVAMTARQTATESELASLQNDSWNAHAAVMWLNHLNEQFGCLWGMEPARTCQGSASPATHNAFHAADSNPYKLGSWQIPISEAAIEQLKPRQRIQSHSQN